MFSVTWQAEPVRLAERVSIRIAFAEVANVGASRLKEFESSAVCEYPPTLVQDLESL